MGAKKKLEYPPWVEKWRKPGQTIRKTSGGGYALFHCATVRNPGEPPKTKQTYLGMITEEEGFIPKKGTTDIEPFLEYGLSHLIWENLRKDILRRLSWSGRTAVLKLGIIQFIFGSVGEEYLKSSYLTYAEVDELAPLGAKISRTRIENAAKATEQELRKKIPMEEEYEMVVKLLMLCVVRPGIQPLSKPAIPKSVAAILERSGLKM